MKTKIFSLLAVIMLISCASHRNARIAKTNIKGDWELTSITYDADGLYKISLFDGQSKECLEGSLWHFVINNTSGYYQFQKATCSTERQNFYFTIEESNDDPNKLYILLKPVDENRKSFDNRGYRLVLASQTENEMRWDMTSNVDGESFKIHLNFKKVNQ